MLSSNEQVLENTTTIGFHPTTDNVIYFAPGFVRFSAEEMARRRDGNIVTPRWP